MDNQTVISLTNKDNVFVHVHETYNIIKTVIDTLTNRPVYQVLIVTYNAESKREWDYYLTYYKFDNVNCESAQSVIKKKDYMLFNTTLLILDNITRSGVNPITFLDKSIIEYDNVFIFDVNNFKYDDYIEHIIESTNSISNIKTYNLVLPFPDDLKRAYAELSSTMLKIHDVFTDSYKLLTTNGRPVFKSDLDVIFACMSGATINGTYVKGQVLIDHLAKRKGWSTNIVGKDSAYAEQIDLYWNPINIRDNVNAYTRCLRSRTSLMSNNNVKRDIIIKIIKRFPTPTLIFNASAKFAEDLELNLESIFEGKAACYHSSISSKFLKDDTGDYVRYKTGAKKGQPKKFGKDSIKKIIQEGVVLGDYKYISLVSSIDQGFIMKSLNKVITSSSDVDISKLDEYPQILETLEENENPSFINIVFGDFMLDDIEVKSRDINKAIANNFNSNCRSIWIKNIDEIC